MKSNFQIFSEQFTNFFYNPVYYKWRIKKEKAGKDIVGEEYENFRREYYKSKGLVLGETNKILGTDVNCDISVKIGEKIVIIEEDKGSYVDSTFLCRAMVDAAKIFEKCISENIEPPLYILSCTTKMKNFDYVFESVLKILDQKLKSVMLEKFKYLPLCNNSRMNKKKYFKTEKNNFVLCENLVKIQEDIINELINK